MSSFVGRQVRRIRKHGIAMALSILGLWLVRAVVSTQTLRTAIDIDGSFLQTFGGMYGVIVGFAIFVTWTQFNETQASIEREAMSLVELYRLLGWFPTWTQRDWARDRLREYAVALPASYAVRGGAHFDARSIIEECLGAFLKHTPSDAAEERLHATTLDRFHELNQARGHRSTVARLRMAEGLRWFVFIGAAFTVLATMLTWVESFAIHAVFVAGMTWVVVAASSIVIDLDDPTSGDFIVDWKHFDDAHRAMQAAHCPVPSAPHPG